MNMNELYEQQKSALKAQWQSMDMASKIFAVLVLTLLMVGGFFSGLFIISTALIITAALYLRSLWQRAFTSRTAL